MKTRICLTLTIIELAQYTAELYRQGINFETHQNGDNEYTFILTGY